MEFCLGALHTKMVMVLGHTACGAIKGATKTFLASKIPTKTKAISLGTLDVWRKATM